MYGTYTSDVRGYGTSFAPPPLRAEPSAFRYTVRDGDSLAAIAAKLNTTEKRLLKLNPLLAPSKKHHRVQPYPGQQLVVEQASDVSLPPPPQCIDQGWGQMHVVRAGETLQLIARQYNTTEAFLRQDNREYFPCGERGMLFPGQMLHVRHVNIGQLEPEEEVPLASTHHGNTAHTVSPASSTTSTSSSSSADRPTTISKYKSHRITKHDTFESLCDQYHITYARLLQINRGRFPVGARTELVVGEQLIMPDLLASQQEETRRNIAEIKLTKQIHVVEQGETPHSIAERFKMTYEELREFNRAYFPKGYRGEIQPGYKLVVKRVEEEEEEEEEDKDDYRRISSRRAARA